MRTIRTKRAESIVAHYVAESGIQTQGLPEIALYHILSDLDEYARAHGLDLATIMQEQRDDEA